MENICKNCDQIITGNFCSQCGQKDYSRIDRKYIWNEMQYTLIHTNKGFLYSVKKIITNPGKTAREFIDGIRINHYKPILLAFVLSGIAAFISFKVIGLTEIMKEYYAKEEMNTRAVNDYLKFASSYASILMIILIPLFALTTKLAFRKWGHNYYEHVIMNSYILSFYTLINILIIYPIFYLFRDNADFIVNLSSWTMLTIPFILFFFFKEFYPDRKLKTIFGKVLLCLLFSILIFGVLILLSVIVGIIYAVIAGPDAVQYFHQN